MGRATEYLWAQAKENLPPLIRGGILAAVIYLFWDFLEPWSWRFFLAISVAIGLLLLLHFNWRWLSGIGLFLFLGSILCSSLNASYFVASDQTRFRFRAVDDVTFFEFQADNPVGKFLVSKFPAKTIVVGECDGQKVARLPRLMFAGIAPIGPAFANKIFFRRFPDLMLDFIEVDVQALAGLSKNKWGEDKKSLSLQLGLRDSEFKATKVTDIVPRSKGCIEDSIPLLPLVETLPWDPDNVGDMIKSAKRVTRLFSLGTTHRITPNDLVELRSEITPNKYAVLLDFLSHSLAHEMLDGNVLAEARTQIREGQCKLINRNANAFLGPFSALTEQLYVSIAAEFGRRAYSAFPSCRIPEELIERFEHEKSNADQPDLKSLQDCISDRANPLSQCQLVANPSRITAELPPTSLPQQTYFDLLDKEFEGVVIDAEGERRVIEQIEPATCPALRDILEEREFVSVWQRSASKILERRFDCNSAGWNKDFERAHSKFKDAQKCSESKHLFEEAQGPVQDDGLDTFDHLKKFRCSRDIFSSMSPSKIPIIRLAEFYDNTNKLESSLVKFRSFEKMTGSDRVSDIISAILARTSFFRIDKAMSSLLFVASAGRFTGYDPG